MRNHLITIGRKVLGVILIIGGFIGLFLPFFQGIAMIIAGAILLENEFVMKQAKKFIVWVQNWRKGK